MDLKNKTAVVTGGNSGIGQAISIALASEGCKVIFTYNSNEKGADDTLEKLGDNGEKFKVDFHNEEGINKLFDFVNKKFGKLDILVNNAGINRPRGLFNAEDWKKIFEIDLFSVVSVTGKAVELMKNGGKVLNVTSI